MILHRVTSLFPLWALLLSGLALWQPEWFTHLKPAIIPLLGVVMFSIWHNLSGAALAAWWSRSRAGEREV